MNKLLIVTIIMSYFIYHIIAGERGMLSMIDIEKQVTEKQKILDELIAERKVLEYKVQHLKPGNYDYDLVDELARQKLGMADPKEKVIVIKKRM
jgi:cell division protein FtsB